MNTNTPLLSVKSQRENRFHSVLTALVLGASAIAVTWSAPVLAGPAADPKKPAKVEIVKERPAQGSGHLRDNHREFNPMTGNFEESAPWGPRSNK